ncbi:MAG: DUF6438 domain-containing protein [Anaerolineae bacterium]|nr:DUF6438 domain-containing protein [Anaerolineae bacterium]
MRKAGLFAILLLLMLVFVLPVGAQEKPVSITLEREPCFGTCPAYSLTIYEEDGTVEYNGLSSVEVEGQQTSQIDKELVAMLVEGFADAGYFEWEDRYDTMFVTDLPYVTTSVTRDGVTKEIFRYVGDDSAPIELAYLEVWIDKVVNSKQWTGKEPFIYYHSRDRQEVMQLDRGECAADDEPCPSYLLTVFDDGLVVYLGIEDVAEVGVHTGTVDAEAVAALADEITEAGYFEWDAKYGDADSDSPIVVTSLLWDEQYHEIIRHIDASTAPEALIALEDRIDVLVNVSQWVDGAEGS